MTTYTPPALPSGMRSPPNGPLIYCFEPLWGAGTPVYFPRYAYEWEQKQNERTAIVAPAGLPGGWDLDGDNWHFWEAMTIALRFKSTSASERRRILAGCVGPGRLWIVDESGVPYWTRARLATPRNQLDIYDSWHALYSVGLEFACPFGAWFAPYTNAGARYGYAHYGAAYYGGTLGQGFVLDGSSNQGEVVNAGNLPAVAMTVTLAASGGTIVTPTIANDATGQEFTITGTLPDGDSWVLDTAAPSLEKDAVDDWGNLTVGANQQGLLYLLPGSNTIQVTSGSPMYGEIGFDFFPPYRI